MKTHSVWKKIILAAVIILAVLGLLFVILMLIPDDEEDAGTVEEQITEEGQLTEENQTAEEDQTVEEEQIKEEETETFSEDPDSMKESDDEARTEETETEESDGSGRKSAVDIPESELSDQVLTFRTVSLDNEELTEDIFSDYDITVVHIWATFCGPCIREMGQYAQFYKDLPGNVNLVGLVLDVEDGSDYNVSDAKEILSDAGAEFTNLRTNGDLKHIADRIDYVPSSFFVDSKGHIIGDIMDGAGFEETKARLNEYFK
ncbi:MAG: TlpA family protein disulfide reductase [Lachnospiraceae bacterium]|nr:TlpA family protein disulfide reductase [Lachnospiraceae bacterium]